MAKINWVFQNESGTNLNRYRAINVATNEEVVFDLFRNGSISIVGTPLSAENLNQLINAINDLYDNYYSKESANNTFVKQTGGKITGNIQVSKDCLLEFSKGAIGCNEDGYVKLYSIDGTILVKNGDTEEEYLVSLPTSGGKFALTKDLNGLASSTSIGVTHLGNTSDETTFLNSKKSNGVYVYTYSTYKYPRILYVYTSSSGYVVQNIIWSNGGTLMMRQREYSSNVWKDVYNGTFIYDGSIRDMDITTSTTIDPTLDKNAGLYRITTRHSSYGTSTALYEAYWNDPDSDEELTFDLISAEKTNKPGVNMPTQDNPHFTAQDGYTMVKIRKIANYI